MIWRVWNGHFPFKCLTDCPLRAALHFWYIIRYCPFKSISLLHTGCTQANEMGSFQGRRKMCGKNKQSGPVNGFRGNGGKASNGIEMLGCLSCSGTFTGLNMNARQRWVFIPPIPQCSCASGLRQPLDGSISTRLVASIFTSDISQTNLFRSIYTLKPPK